MRRRSRPIVAGVAAAAAYVAVAMLTFRSGVLPVRPLYEGVAPPPPYRWVVPPPDLVSVNQPPEPGEGTVKLGPQGSEASTISTNDGQTVVAFQPGSIKPRAGETSAKVTITPLDPVTVGTAPDGYDYDGNAYRITATYASSGDDVEIATATCPGGTPAICPTVVLRFPLFGTELHRFDAPTWTKLQSHTSPVSLQVFGDTAKLGVFVVAGPELPPEPAPSKIGLYVAIGLGAVALIIAAVLYRSRPARRWVRRKLRRSKKAPVRPRSASRGAAPARGVQKKKRRR